MVIETKAEPEVGKRGTAQVGPLMHVSGDVLVHFVCVKRTFRIILYGAYNAHGLIGPEFNGVAVLDEDNKRVLTDRLAQAQSGYHGPTRDQVRYFKELQDVDWDTFRDIVNTSEHSRGYDI